MKTLRLALLILVAPTLLGGLTGCRRSLREQLVGKWQQQQGPLTIDFVRDGRFNGSMGPVTFSGTYTTPDEKHVTLEVSGAVGSFLGSRSYGAKIEGDVLSLTSGAQTETFRRMKGE